MIQFYWLAVYGVGTMWLLADFMDVPSPYEAVKTFSDQGHKHI